MFFVEQQQQQIEREVTGARGVLAVMNSFRRNRPIIGRWVFGRTPRSSVDGFVFLVLLFRLSCRQGVSWQHCHHFRAMRANRSGAGNRALCLYFLPVTHDGVITEEWQAGMFFRVCTGTNYQLVGLCTLMRSENIH